MSITDQQFREALRAIVTTSDTEEEVKRRASVELGHPYTVAVTSSQPTDAVGHAASSLVAALGGCHLCSGAMVMVMTYSPSGEVIQL